MFSFNFDFLLSILKPCPFPDIPYFQCAFRHLDFTAELLSEMLRMKIGLWCSLTGPRERRGAPHIHFSSQTPALLYIIMWTEASEFTFRFRYILSWQGSKSSTMTRSKRVNISVRCEENLLRQRKWKRKSLTETIMSVWCIPQLMRSRGITAYNETWL